MEVSSATGREGAPAEAAAVELTASPSPDSGPLTLPLQLPLSLRAVAAGQGSRKVFSPGASSMPGEEQRHRLLAELRLLDFEPRFCELGAASLEELATLRYEDLLGIGLSKVQVHLFLEWVAQMQGHYCGAAFDEDTTSVGGGSSSSSRSSFTTSGLLAPSAPPNSARRVSARWRGPARRGPAAACMDGYERWRPSIGQDVCSSSQAGAGAAHASWFSYLFASVGSAFGVLLGGLLEPLRYSQPVLPALQALPPPPLPLQDLGHGTEPDPVGGDWPLFWLIAGLFSAGTASGASEAGPGLTAPPNDASDSTRGDVMLHALALTTPPLPSDGIAEGSPVAGLGAEGAEGEQSCAANEPGCFTMVSADYWCLRTMTVSYTTAAGEREHWRQSGYGASCSVPASATDVEVAFCALGGYEVQRVDRTAPRLPFILPSRSERFRYAKCPEGVGYEVAGTLTGPYVSSVVEVGSRHLSAVGSLVTMPEVLCRVGSCSGTVVARRLRETCRAAAAALKEVLEALAHDKYIYVCSGSCRVERDFVERLCPRTGQWETLPPTRLARRACTVASTGGRFFVIGGAPLQTLRPRQKSPGALREEGRGRRHLPEAGPSEAALLDGPEDATCRQAECFDPVTGKWELLPPVAEHHTHAAAVAAGGFVYVFGGLSLGQVLSKAQRFDPIRHCWERLDDLPSARFECAACALNGLIYVLGGATLDGEVLALVERYNPTTNEWLALPRLREPRYGCAAAAAGGLVFALGGRGLWTDLSSVELFDPALGEWRDGPSLQAPRNRCGAVAVSNRIYVLGGNGNGQDILTMEALSIDSMEWESAGEPPRKGGHCAAVAVSS